METYRDVFKPGRKLWISIFGVVLEGFCSGANFIVLLKLLNLIFDGNIVYRDIIKAVVMLAVIFAARLVLYAASYTGSQIGGADVSKKIRVAIGDKLRKIPLGLFTKNRTGFYINAATTEAGDYEQILTHKIADITKFSILTAMMGVYASYLCLPVGIIILMTLFLLVPAMAFSIRQVNVYGVSKNQAREENVSAITEYLVGGQVLRSYHLAGTKNVALTKSMKKYSDISYEYERAVLPIGFLYVFLTYIGIAMSLIIMTDRLDAGRINAPQMIVLLMILLYVSKVEMTLYINLVSYKNLRISKNKIKNIFGEQEEVECGKLFEPTHYDVAFQGVDFAYIEGEPVLNQATFVIPENRLTAIVGDSGSGKSTIFNLIGKYYAAEGGKILIGGEDIRDISAEQVLSIMSMVDQEVFLFQDTVIQNIRYARENATKEEIVEACKLANCHDFIMRMEKGYDTVIGENGNNLSGGERQRLSIARAILRNSPIVLLDEVTASLDIENELLVKKAINNLLKMQRTVVMIAHTISIVENADHILVLDQGRIVESGNHRELIQLGGKYKNMWNASKRI